MLKICQLQEVQELFEENLRAYGAPDKRSKLFAHYVIAPAIGWLGLMIVAGFGVQLLFGNSRSFRRRRQVGLVRLGLIMVVTAAVMDGDAYNYIHHYGPPSVTVHAMLAVAVVLIGFGGLCLATIFGIFALLGGNKPPARRARYESATMNGK